ncbi:hypothetical protein P5V15_006659 [Pogonomyrmex californicus]
MHQSIKSVSKQNDLQKDCSHILKHKEIIDEVQIDNECVNIGKLILNNLKCKPDFIGQVDAATGKQNTFCQMREKSIKCAVWLRNFGILRGDIITICTDNQIDAYVPYFAALYLGAIVNPWPKQQKGIKSSTEHYLTRITPKVIFTDYDNADKINTVIKKKRINIKVIVFGTHEDKKFESLDVILSGKELNMIAVNTFACVKLKSNRDPAIILLSSGTTGFCRDVEIPHTIFTALSNNEVPYMKFGQIGLWFESLHWIIGLLLTVRAIISYVTVIKASGFDDEHQLCQIIEKYKVDWVFLESSMSNKLQKYNVFQKYKIPSLDTIIFGGPTIKQSFYRRLKRALPNVLIIQVYYLPETGILAHQEVFRMLESNSSICRNVNLIITDFATKEQLGPNSIGAIWCRSPSMMIGYYNDSRSTSKIIDKNGWFRSEDVGYYDNNGNIFVIDRVNRLIRYRHRYISPVEIENILETHPDVSEAVVIGLPHDYDTFRPIALVQLIPETEAHEDELVEYVKMKVDCNWKRLHGVFLTKDMPYIANNTIDRVTISQMLQNCCTYCA